MMLLRSFRIERRTQASRRQSSHSTSACFSLPDATHCPHRLSYWVLAVLLVLLSDVLPCGPTMVAAEEAGPQTQTQPKQADSGKTTTTSSDDTAETRATTTPKKQALDPKDLEPVVLTSRNFGQSISDGNVWLIEIYAPWCGHCVSFASTYSEIAAHFHSQPHLGVKVGKIDGDAERALSARFNVMSFPCFFVVDGWSVYSFEDKPRSKQSLIQFVQPLKKMSNNHDDDDDDNTNKAEAAISYKNHYSADEPMPYHSSPLGPIGLAQGTLIATGYAVADLFVWLQDTFSLSPLLAGMVLFGGAFVGCFISIVILAIAMTPKEKVD